jgi:hypothetical protein
VLLLITFRSMIWNHYRGVGHWLIHGFQLFAAVVLCFLSILAKGSKHFNAQFEIDGTDAGGPSMSSHGDDTPLAPLYEIVISDLPLVIVLGVYLLAYVGSGAVMWIIHWRRKRGVYYEDEA